VPTQAQLFMAADAVRLSSRAEPGWSRMKLAKRFGNSPVVASVVCRRLAHYIRLVELTTRWTVHDAGGLQRMSASGEPFIAAFWHGRMVLMAGAWRRFGSGRAIHILISQHRDGRTISRVIGHLGINSIAGSSSSGGAGRCVRS
jgi:lysophospholipid acyltransferase (LPLAT)-like uncharacterized protein